MGRPISELLAISGKKANLRRIDSASTPGFSDREKAEERTKKNRERLSDLQFRLYAENKRALLVVLQGTDTSGKDGAIRHVFSGVNPQGCQVTSFKAPAGQELKHDFLRRIHTAAPAHGVIGIFNRSHYEDVVAARVKKIVLPGVWKKRYDTINSFEKMLTESGTTILKFYLHISKAEQKERLEKRLSDPAKHWKMNLNDIEERKLWGATVTAYEDALTRCDTAWAPWYVVPSDRKWYRNAAISEIVADTLECMNPEFPQASDNFAGVKIP
jgi:PPK2 family polyphosphate:nucleotide phosphotransferase